VVTGLATRARNGDRSQPALRSNARESGSIADFTEAKDATCRRWCQAWRYLREDTMRKLIISLTAAEQDSGPHNAIAQ
jgi:hypothetical protein